MVCFCKNKRMEFCKYRFAKKILVHNTLIHNKMDNIPPTCGRTKFCTNPNQPRKNPAGPAG